MTQVQNIEVNEDDHGVRLDRWFKRYYPHVGHGTIEKALRKGQIKVDAKRATASQRLERGQLVRVPPLQAKPAQVKEKRGNPISSKYIKQIQDSVIYKDKDILVLNKPSGMATQGGNKVKVSVDSLARHIQFEADQPPKLVHRLDKDTSGILLMARKTSIAAKLGEAFRNRDVEKVYWAVVVGVPELKKGKVDLPLAKGGGEGKEKMCVDEKEGKKALTYFRILDRAGDKLSLVELTPVTGRMHQLRVHMAAIGTPILGDGKYGGRDAFMPGMSKTLHLHARSVIIPDFKGKGHQFIAELPEHIVQTCKEFGLEA